MIVASKEETFSLGYFEHRTGNRHSQVAALHEDEPAAHGKAVDGGDDRFGRLPFAVRVAEGMILTAGSAPLQNLFHVVPGAKSPARSSEHGDLQVRIVVELGKRSEHLGSQLQAQSVQPVRTIQLNQHDSALNIDIHH